MLARRQQLVLGQRSRSKHTDNSTFEWPLAAPLFLGGGILDLFTKRNPVAGLDQSGHIAINCMDRHPTHRNVITIAFPSFGKGNAKDIGADFGILEEHLVEITHAVKQQRILLAFLDLQILGNHRCRRLYISPCCCLLRLVHLLVLNSATM